MEEIEYINGNWGSGSGDEKGCGYGGGVYTNYSNFIVYKWFDRTGNGDDCGNGNGAGFCNGTGGGGSLGDGEGWGYCCWGSGGVWGNGTGWDEEAEVKEMELLTLRRKYWK